MQPSEPNLPQQPPYASTAVAATPPLPTLQEPQRYDMPAGSLNGSRLLAVILIVVGGVLAYILKNAHDTGGSMSEKMVIFTPAILIFGIAGVIWPRLMLVGRRNAPPQPMVYRVMAVILGIFAVGIGILVRFTLFSAWR